MFRIQIGKFLFFVLTIVLSSGAALGQSSSFTYQGRLTDGGAPANGNYDLQVALFDSETGGTQVGQVMPSIRAWIDVIRDSGACRLHAAPKTSADTIAAHPTGRRCVI